MTRLRAVFLPLAAVASLAAFQAPSPEGDLARLAKSYLSGVQPSDWRQIEALPNTRWAPLPPTALTNCLPNGDCFVRQGSATVGGRNLVVCSMTDHCWSVMVMTGLDRVFRFAPDPMTALATLQIEGL